jgi:mannosyl-oligosaccharide glucosidase
VDLKSTVVFYAGAQGIGSIALANEPDSKGLEGTVKLSGSFPELGDFELQITPGPDTNSPPTQVNQDAWDEQPLDRSIYNAVMLQGKDVWKSKGKYSRYTLCTGTKPNQMHSS